MASLFISYSRKDIEAARKLTEAFKGPHLDFWIDWEGIPPTVDWWKEVEKGIEETDFFLFLLSPDSAGSKVCRQEIEHAVRNGKRLIPVIVRTTPASDAPPELRALNWIYLREQDNFRAGFSKVMQSIKTDFVWAQVHRQLQVKALEWERSRHKPDLLLHGEELREAEIQLATNSSKEPHPTDLQREYVLRSRQQSDRRRRVTTVIAIAGIIALTGLAIFGFVQARQANANAQESENNAATALANEAEAKRQATIAISRQFAANSMVNQDRRQLSVLLALEAFDRVANFSPTERLQPEQALRDSLSQIGGIPLRGYKGFGNTHTFSPDGRWLVVWAWETRLFLFDLQKPTAEPAILPEEGGHVHDAAFSPDSRSLLLVTADHPARVWDLQDLSLKPRSFPDPAFVFTPDGKWLLTWNWEEGLLRLWDWMTGSDTPQSLPGQTGGIDRLNVSPDARWLAIAGSDQVVRLWDLQNISPGPVEFGRYTGPMDKLIFSPDSRWLLIATFENENYVWNVQNRTSRPLGALYAPLGSAGMFLFSPDGRWLITEGLDEDVQDKPQLLWDLQNETTAPLPLEGLYQALLFSHDSRRLLASAPGPSVRILDPENLNAEPLILPVQGGVITSLALSPDDQWLAAGITDTSVRLWYMKDLPADPILLRGHEAPREGDVEVQFSPDNRWLLSNTVDGIPRLWNLQVLFSEPKMFPHGPFTFSPDGHSVAAEGLDHSIRVMNMEDPSDQSLLQEGYEDRVTRMVFSPDGHWLAMESQRGDSLVLDRKQPKTEGIYLGLKDLPRMYTFSPDGRWLVTLGDKSAELWDMNDLRAPVKTILHNIFIESIALSPNSHWLATGSGDGLIQLVDLSHPEVDPIALHGHRDRILALAFSPDHRWLVSGSYDQTARLWDLQNPTSPSTLLQEQTGYIDLILFTPDGHWLATGSYDGKARLWKTQQLSDEPVTLDEYTPNKLIPDIAFSPDSRWIAMAGGGQQSARVWDLQNLASDPYVLIGREERARIGTDGGLTFSPNGHQLATWNGENVRLWDLQNLSAEPILFRGHNGDITNVLFSADGQWMATRSDDQTLLWNLNIDEVREKACEVLGRNFTREEWMQFLPDQEYTKTCLQWSLEPEVTATPSPAP